MTFELTLLILGAVVAGAVQGLAGFAFGMVAMAIWAWGIDPQEATVLAVIGGLCGQLLAAFTIRRRVAAAELLPFVIGGLLGVPLGTHLLPLIQNFNLAILAATTVALLWKGVVTRSMVPHLGLVVAALLVPAILGSKLHGRLSDSAFRRVVLVLLTPSGVTLLASAL